MKHTPFSLHTFSKLLAASSVVALASLSACGGSDRSAEQPTGYQERLSAELESERQDFVENTEERLDDLDQRIAQLRTRIQGESQFVSESQQAEWRVELFELEREREDAQARLDKVRDASPAEWTAMRDGIGLQVDRLQAAVDELGSSINEFFESRDERQPAAGEDLDEYDDHY
jgi:TolA-binding protein